MEQLKVTDLLRRALAVAQVLLEEGNKAVTGRRWRRPPETHPAWCANDHTCTARDGYPSGEHRAPVVIVNAAYGRLVANRSQRVDSAPRMELRMTVLLDHHDQVAIEQGGQLILGVDLTVRAVLAEIAGKYRIPVSIGRAA